MRGGRSALESSSSGPSFYAPSPSPSKVHRVQSLGDLGVCFPQRGLRKLIPAVSWWGRGRPEARRRGGGKGVGGEAPPVRSCSTGEKLRENCEPETPFT